MILYVGVHPRFFTDGDAKVHIVEEVMGKLALCGREIFGVMGTLTPEDKFDSDLCKKCREKVDWSQVESGEKVWMEMEYLLRDPL
jgi:hypothetical protein